MSVSAAVDNTASTATAWEELQDIAALLWSSNEKGLIHLHPSDSGQLAHYLGPERIRHEIANDAELAAERQMKGFAAAVLISAAELERESAERDRKKRSTGAKRKGDADEPSIDIDTLKGLYQILFETIDINMMSAPEDIPTLVAETTEGAPQPSDTLKRLLVSTPALVMRQASKSSPQPICLAAQAFTSGHAGVLGKMSNLHDHSRAASFK